jgi:hypothetical protein
MIKNRVILISFFIILVTSGNFKAQTLSDTFRFALLVYGQQLKGKSTKYGLKYKIPTRLRDKLANQ